ncbi:general stress protein A [Oxobacter pfennigii]|uniref:General stress protein A n=1 Tax=Oxobacter pfennigii TaxID=36849 RepID=A0A0P9AIA0_9CLOT|nr:glycosyltransferase family 8 protein [Oxobacter pfennigii]KPU45189.1 general stress protein A [Oxobacter pfennigii]
MNILVTLNSNYIKPLKIMLKSLFINNQEESFSIYLIHSSIKDEELDDLNSYIRLHGSQLIVITIDDSYFENAPVVLHYTKEMYYRLLAFKFLPQNLDKILYLDPDILVINPIRDLYYMDIKGFLYAAAYHDVISIKEINRLRLNPYEIDAYYNSGVLLMNLELQRQLVDEQSIYKFAEKNKSKLIMPDQDILNALYSKKIKSLDEKLYNYDARYYTYYKIRSNRVWDMDHVIRNTVILHFCGKKKPWKRNYSGKFHSLYKHYEKLALS